MVEVPDVTPLTTPVVEPMVATEVLVLLHVPPDVPSVNVVVLPAQTEVVPEIVAGTAFTVTTAIARQPPDTL